MFRSQINLSIPDRIEMTKSVFDEITKTIGKFPAETGGILGMRGNKIDRFFFDETPNGGTKLSYTPNHAAINKVLSETWTPTNTIYMGAVHSHPTGLISPSFGDKYYAQQLLGHIMKNFKEGKPYFYIPIVQSSGDVDKFTLHSYIACYRGTRFCIEKIDLYIDGQRYLPKTLTQLRPVTLPKPTTHQVSYELPSRQLSPACSMVPNRQSDSTVRANPACLQSMFPELFQEYILKHKTIISIGTLDVTAYLESLAKYGVGKFVLLDASQGSKANMEQQERIKNRILSANRDAEITCVDVPFCDRMTVADFLKAVGDSCKGTLKYTAWSVLIADLRTNCPSSTWSCELAEKLGASSIKVNTLNFSNSTEVAFKGIGAMKPRQIKCTARSASEYVSGLNDVKKLIGLLLLSRTSLAQIEKCLNEHAKQNDLSIDVLPSGISTIGSSRLNTYA